MYEPFSIWEKNDSLTYKPFSIWEKNDSLRISFSLYSEPSWLKFPFRHLWQEQIFSFGIIQQPGKKALACNFLHCKTLNSSLGCFLVPARWSSETTLYTHFGLSKCFCSKCSFTCSTSLKKNFLWWYFFGEALLPWNCS